MDVSIIIVNYNTCKLILQAIKSIYTFCVNVDFEIIVVDNASTDNSKNIITSNFPDVNFIESDRNLGFGGANNLGAKHARGKYLFLLNPDTIIKNNVLQFFLDYKFNNDPEDKTIGVMGAYLVDEELNLNTYGGDIINCFTPFNNLLNFFSHNKLNKDVTITSGVGYVSGADMFISKSIFDTIGGFDEGFFIYCEEVDLQKRIRDRGRKNIIIPGPNIIHLEGGGTYKSRGLSVRQFAMWQQSRKYYINKHFNLFEKCMWKMFNIIYSLALVLKQKWTIKEKFELYMIAIKS